VQGYFLVVPSASVTKLKTSQPLFGDATLCNHSEIAKLHVPDGALFVALKRFVRKALAGAGDADSKVIKVFFQQVIWKAMSCTYLLITPNT